MASEPRSVRSVTQQTHSHAAARPRAEAAGAVPGATSHMLSVLCHLVSNSVLVDIWLSDRRYV